MKKQMVAVIVIGVILSVWFVKAILTPALTPDQIYREPPPTPTINYYQDDLFAQCNGLESLKDLLEKHPSLKINANFNKDYQRVIDNIERDKEMLGLDYFDCQ